MCLSIHTLFLLINTYLQHSLAVLPSVFVETLFCKDEGPGPLSLTTSLVARIWCFHCSDPAQYLAGKPRPAPSCSRLMATQDWFWSVWGLHACGQHPCPWWGFQHLQKSSKILLHISFEGEPRHCPKADLLFLLMAATLSCISSLP